MCLIAFSYQQHSNYPLIFAANRDENYERPTRAARFWDENHNILAGKDLKAGGTWMGISRRGTFSALTNYRDMDIQKEDPPSRGHLVLDYLKHNDDPKDYLQKVDQKADQYMGFSLLAGTLDQLGYYSNQQKKVQMLDAGLYGLSNHLLNTDWPKVMLAKQKLREVIKEDQISEESLFDLLADEQKAPDNKLPSTGIPKEIERKVSPIFIKSNGYGTRCSTILLVDKDGKVTFVERRFTPGTLDVEEENRYEFLVE